MFVCLCISESLHSCVITCVFTTVQTSHKGVFSEKDKIGVGLLFLYPKVGQIMERRVFTGLRFSILA